MLRGQVAPASRLKLWSRSVYTYTHSQTRYFSVAWRVADDYSTQRKYTKETHTSLLIHLTTTTHTATCLLTRKHLISHMLAHPPCHSHIPQDYKQHPKHKNMDGSEQHNNRADNLLVVLRQVFRWVSQITWAFILGPQSLPHSNHSVKEIQYVI